MFFTSFALAGQFLTAEPNCSSEVQRLSCWSQSVNQLSSRCISRSINIGSTEGNLPEPSWGSPAQCPHRHLGITPHNSQHVVWGLQTLFIASLSGYIPISTTVGGKHGERSSYETQMWWWSMICSSVLFVYFFLFLFLSRCWTVVKSSHMLDSRKVNEALIWKWLSYFTPKEKS